LNVARLPSAVEPVAESVTAAMVKFCTFCAVKVMVEASMLATVFTLLVVLSRLVPLYEAEVRYLFTSATIWVRSL
jgi:hypothetical protein